MALLVAIVRAARPMIDVEQEHDKDPRPSYRQDEQGRKRIVSP
jgi:hypothetical protein